MHTRRPARLANFLTALAVLACTTAATSDGVAAALSAPTAAPASVSASSTWLDVVNNFRLMSGLAPVAEDPTLSAAEVSHSCYMLSNGITHYEDPAAPGYTADGEAAGKVSNVAVASNSGQSARDFVNLWMTGPFHAIGILRPNLQTASFGACVDTTQPKWHAAASLDVIRGLKGTSRISRPILFPGDGATTTLSGFATETPDPRSYCGMAPNTAAGLPLIAMMPEGFTGQPTATLTGAAGPLDVCVLSAGNTTADAANILGGNNAVVVLPSTRLSPGTYAVNVTTSSRSVDWHFTVGTTDSVPTPSATLPSATVVGTGALLNAVAPFRLVDTRAGVGAQTLAPDTVARIQVTGIGGVPDGAMAVSANFTVVGPRSDGYLTVWDCSTNRPVVSTLNFAANQTVPNGAMVPLDSGGGICASSSATTDLVVDVNGYDSVDGGGRFSPVSPARLMDTRVGLGAPTRLASGSVTALQIRGVAGVPVSATMAALNVTGVSPGHTGYVTVYPCDQQRPLISSLNPVPGRAIPNLVIAPIAGDGTVCLYTLTDVDLVVDVTGYVSADAAQTFTASAPFRLVDTREQVDPALQAGTNGNPVQQGQTLVIQIAGTRGIAADAKSISANFTSIGTVAPGYITVWPCGPRPQTSVLNFVPGKAIANGAQVSLSATGTLCVFASNDASLIIDVSGWWS